MSEQMSEILPRRPTIRYGDAGQLITFFAVGLPSAYIILALIEATSYLWYPLTIALYGLAFVASSAYSLLLFRYDSRLGQRVLDTEFSEISESKELEQGYGLPFVLSALVVLVVSFTQLCRYLTLEVGGFAADQMGYWHWLRFGISWIVDNLLFNTSQILGWNISEIHPMAEWARILTIIFNVILELAAIAGVIRWVQITRNVRFRWVDLFSGLSYGRYLRLRIISMTALSVTLIPTIVFIAALVQGSLSVPDSVTAIRYIALPLLSLWFAWINLRGTLVVEGVAGKIFAISGVVLGIGGLYFTVPALWSYLIR